VGQDETIYLQERPTKGVQVQQPLHGFGLIGWVQILESMTKIDGTPKGFD
jgi:hypothetical protein